MAYTTIRRESLQYTLSVILKCWPSKRLLRWTFENRTLLTFESGLWVYEEAHHRGMIITDLKLFYTSSAAGSRANRSVETYLDRVPLSLHI